MQYDRYCNKLLEPARLRLFQVGALCFGVASVVVTKNAKNTSFNLVSTIKMCNKRNERFHGFVDSVCVIIVHNYKYINKFLNIRSN